MFDQPNKSFVLILLTKLWSHALTAEIKLISCLMVLQVLHINHQNNEMLIQVLKKSTSKKKECEK